MALFRNLCACPACPVGRNYRTGVKCLPNEMQSLFLWGQSAELLVPALGRDAVFLDFHGIMFWAKKAESTGMKLKLFPILILFLMIIPGVGFAGQYKVVQVIDGDTIVIRYNEKYEKVGLLCVNTPKSVNHDEKQRITMAEIAFRYTQKKTDRQIR
jgi:endonuclease YncB( thermonuclease family)